MSLTSMVMTERPGSTSSTLAPMCLEKVTSSLKYRARWSSCSSLRAIVSSLTGRSLLFRHRRPLGPFRSLTLYLSGSSGEVECWGFLHHSPPERQVHGGSDSPQFTLRRLADRAPCWMLCHLTAIDSKRVSYCTPAVTRCQITS